MTRVLTIAAAVALSMTLPTASFADGHYRHHHRHHPGTAVAAYAEVATAPICFIDGLFRR
jgi:hypothetical protein